MSFRKEDFVFSGEETLYLKGIAIILMIANHLYPIQEWIYPGNEFIGVKIGQKTIEAYIGSFGKICVAMFAFLSGFGLWYIYNKRGIIKGYIYTIKKLIKFLIVYWVIIIIIYIPIMWISGVLVFSIKEFGLNLLGYKTSYIRIAWYVRFYLECIITFPMYLLIGKISKFNKNINEIIIIILIYVISGILTMLNCNEYLIEYFKYMPIVILGYIFSKYSIFLTVDNKIKNMKKRYRLNDFIIVGVGILIVFVFRGVINEIGNISIDVVYVPIFIYLLLYLKNNFDTVFLYKLLVKLGKYSTELWFLHAIFFIGNYYVQRIAYWPKISVIILIWILILLMPISILINNISNYISKLIIRE